MSKRFLKTVPDLRFPEFTEEWTTQKVGNICDCIVPGRNKPKTFKGNIPWITVPDIKNGRVNISNTSLRVSHKEAESIGSKVVPKDSVLMSCAGELGITAITNCEIVINQQLHAFLPSNLIDSLFLLNSIATQKKYIDSVATKTAVPYLNKTNCNSIPIIFPSIAEQEKIASFLGAVDARLSQLRRKHELLQTYKRGVMQRLFSQQIRFKQDDGSDFPDWQKKKISEFAPLQRGFDLPVSQIIEGPFPVVFSNGILKMHHEYKVVSPGVVTGRSGTIGNIVYVEKNFWPHNTSLWVTDFKKNLPRFVYYFYIYLDLTRFSSGSGVPTLNRNDIHARSMEFPCVQEQGKIANFLTLIDQKITVIEKQIKYTERFKKGLFQKMFV